MRIALIMAPWSCLTGMIRSREFDFTSFVCCGTCFVSDIFVVIVVGICFLQFENALPQAPEDGC